MTTNDAVDQLLRRIAAAAEANATLTALLAAQADHEQGLLEAIREAHDTGALDTEGLYTVYLAYREITRSAYPASWKSARLPHPNSLHAAHRRATSAVARSDDANAPNAHP